MRKGTLLIILFIALSGSCGRRGTFPPAGSYSNVVLVTETGKAEGVAAEMIRALQHELDYYNRLELQFFVRPLSAEQFGEEPPSKNVVLLGVVRQGEIGRIIEGFAGASAVQQVLSGESNIFRRLNFPNSGQLTVIVTASSGEMLDRIVSEKGQLVREIIEEANRERLRDYLTMRVDRQLTDRLRNGYRFELPVSSLFRLNQERDDVPGIELVAVDAPHRGLVVSWRRWEKGVLSLADSTALFDVRTDLAWKMYDKDVMRRELVRFSNDELGPYPAVRMEGYWENSENVAGGPFICFFVLDGLAKKLWIVDCVVYAPGFKKHPFLRELHAYAEAFRI